MGVNQTVARWPGWPGQQAGVESGQGKLITGGKVPDGQDKGYFYEVTLFDDVANEPFGGYKRSGIGREFGQVGYDEYTEVKAISYHAG